MSQIDDDRIEYALDHKDNCDRTYCAELVCTEHKLLYPQCATGYIGLGGYSCEQDECPRCFHAMVLRNFEKEVKQRQGAINER